MTRIVFLVTLCTITLAGSGTSAARLAADDRCLQPGETAVQMRAADGVTVYGVEVGAGTTGVVLAHQYLSDHCGLMEYARALSQQGYRTLAIDFRCYGLSSCESSRRLDLDVAAAVAQLRTDGATHIKLIGASMGGTAVLVASSRIRPVVQGVVSLSGPVYFRGLNARLAVIRSRVPVRFLVSRGDRRFVDDANFLMRRASAKDKGILRLWGADHGSSMLQRPAAQAYVLTFLAR